MSEKQMTRREMVGALGGIALAAALGTRRAFAADERPNILYIMTDDHAAHALSCYGSRINKTPNLDRIAREGMRFENAFVTNSLCGPSRATLLTGKYSHLNGFRRNGDRFDGSQQTFPKLLQAGGYQTAMIGKWHLESDPTGFDYWNILPGQGAYNNPAFIEMGKNTRHQGYVTDLITDFSLDWLRKRDKARPFCLLLHHKAPHRNWQPDAKHADLYAKEEIREPDTFDDDWSTRSSAARDQKMTIENDLTRSDVKEAWPADLKGEALKKWKYQRFIKDYLRVIASVDDNVGRVLDFLDKEGLADSTIVIYTTDNGFFLGDHGWFDKRFMFEESLRVPLMVRYPTAVKAATTDAHLVINPDFAPTFLDFAGQPVPADIQGRSIRPILEGKPPADWRKSIYYHYYEFPAVHSVQRHYGVRTDRYKLIHYYLIGEWELFDLQKDPHELHNLYADPAYAEVRKQMEGGLARLRAELKVPDDTAAAGARSQAPAAPGQPLDLALDLAACTLVDGKGSKLALIDHGTALADGPRGKARQFDGKGAYLDLPGNLCPNPAGIPLAVSAWVRPAAPDGVVLAHGGASLGYALHLEGGKPAFSTRVDDKLTQAAGPDKLPDAWTHLAGSLAKDGTMTLYVAGKPVATAKAPGLLARKPFDGLQVGADTGSPILEGEGSRFLGGLIAGLRLAYGEDTEKRIADDAKG